MLYSSLLRCAFSCLRLSSRLASSLSLRAISYRPPAGCNATYRAPRCRTDTVRSSASSVSLADALETLLAQLRLSTIMGLSSVQDPTSASINSSKQLDGWVTSHQHLLHQPRQSDMSVAGLRPSDIARSSAKAPFTRQVPCGLPRLHHVIQMRSQISHDLRVVGIASNL